MRELVCILSTPIDVLDTPGVLARLDQFIQEKRFHQVATANVDFVVNAMGDAELRHILRVSDLVTPDGMPLVWASRMLGRALPERVTGADIVPLLAELSARKGYRIYMLGARPEVAQKARENMLQAHPTLQIVGCVSPPPRPLEDMDTAGLLADIRAARPDILLVAFGNPKQEKWIYRNRKELRDVPICMGVGGTFDFLAGQTVRAPEWMRTSGLEWLFRLAQEPKRLWKRYMRDVSFFACHFCAQWRACRPDARRTALTWVESVCGASVVLAPIGRLDATQQMELQMRACRALDLSTNLVLDFTRTDTLDAAAIGTLLNLPKRVEYAGREVGIAGANARILHALKVARAHEVLTFYATLEEALARYDAIHSEPASALTVPSPVAAAMEEIGPNETVQTGAAGGASR
jgi:N-acetylglucosaminyldiphosphoundecaprenol N-acetyl-beta-D-mannosaminyltransferase